MEVNGWSNKATWEVSYVLTNDLDNYFEMYNYIENLKLEEITKEKVEEIVTDMHIEDTINFAEVNWEELATEWREIKQRMINRDKNA